MTYKEFGQTACNIGRSLSIVGDRWSLMIMHEIQNGNRRFEVLQAHTSMSSHLLVGRLRRLERQGILERRVYSSKPPRHEYFATEKGRYFDELLLALRRWNALWGREYLEPEVVSKLLKRRKGRLSGPAWNAPDGALFSFGDCKVVLSPRWKAERLADAASFRALRSGTHKH